MEIKKVPDIKIRAKNEQGDLEWRSLRGQKMMAEGLWRTILPGNYRLSHEGYWYELLRLEADIKFTWFPNPNNPNPGREAYFIVNTEAYPKGNYTLPYDSNTTFTVTFNKEDESVKDQTAVANTSMLAFGRYRVNKCSDVPTVLKSITFRDGTDIRDVSQYPPIKYNILNDSLRTPTISTYVDNVSFGIDGGDTSVLISPTTGDIAYMYLEDTAKTADWEIVDTNTPTPWLSIAKDAPTSNLKIHCEPNTGSDREYTITLRHSVYPFITTSIKISQSENQGSIIKDAEWLVIQFNWLKTAGNDLDNKVGFESTMTILDNKYRGFGHGGSTKLNQILLWGGDRQSPSQSDAGILIPGETYILNVKKLKELYRNELSNTSKLALYSHWWNTTGINNPTLNITAQIQSYKGGEPKLTQSFVYEIVDSVENGPAIRTGGSSIQGYNLPVIASSSGAYSLIGNIKYVKGATPNEDELRIEGA